MSGGAPGGAKTSADTLLKVLDLEARHRFDDSAVAGGLDTFLRSAVARAAGPGEAPAEPLNPILAAIAALPQTGYRSLNPAQRAGWALQTRGLLQRGGAPPARRSATRPASADPARLRADPVSRSQQRAQQRTPQGRQPRPQPGAESRAPQRAQSPPSSSGSGLQAPIGTLGRVRAETVQKLARVGVQSVGDLLWYFPHRHADFTNVKQIAELVVGDEATVVGTVRTSRVAFIGRRIRSTEAVIEDGSGRIRALWFNQPYLAGQLPERARVGLAGKVGAYRGRLQFEAPEWEVLDRPGGGADEEEGTHVGRFVPVYPLTQGLPGRAVRRLARVAVDRYADLVPEALPPAILEETGYLREAEAIRQLHFPDCLEMRDAARERLAFEELLAIQIAVLQRKREARARRDAPMIRLEGAFLQPFVDALPFQLTSAQMRAITQIRADLAQTEPMARLLQGDVGSGKTVVAAAAMLGSIAAGYQAVLMAPTEILAEQHYRTFNRLFGGQEEGSVFHDYTVAPALGRPVRMALLTGSTPTQRKRQMQDALQRGELDIVVGTHALIQERVGIDRLGLAVVDEQHRFGVLQRDALRTKGRSPHLLVMTATPIPRTLALTIYGDLDVSRLDEMPPGRHPVETHSMGPEDRAEVYGRVREEIAKGRQAFIICPLVEESEAIEAKAAVQEFERLRASVFPDRAEGMRLLHGRMAGAEKEAIMAEFRGGGADILVSTSVVEVGVDVPSATVMVIEGAERFGLSQLHQFRGRVGRSAYQSYCYLLSEEESSSSRGRLQLMERTNDGFELAEADLEMRGPGEYFGTRQSGLPDLRVAKLTDHALLLKARNYAERILEMDVNLRAPEHGALATRAGLVSVAGAEAVH